MDVVNSLLRAARSGNLKRVLEIVEDDLVDINVSNNNGLTALHSASKEGHTRIVDELLARGANVNARTLKGNQPIHIASLAGHEPVVRRLLDHGADVNAQSTSGFTSLYMAAQENHESIVKLLLDRGADQNISTTDGFTPLAVSLQQNHENIAKILLNHEARGQVRFPGVTDTGRSLLHVAAKKNDCAAAALLLQNNISPDVTSKSNFTSLHVACHYGNEAVAKLLIDNGADVNFQAKQNITPLHVAARWDQLAMVNLLLDHNARIDAQTKDHLTPLHCVARMGHDACVELLIKRGAPISAKTRSHLVPLHMSAQGNHLKSAQILLNNRAPVDDVTIDHLTSLHVASHCGHVKVAKLLLDYDADPNLRAQNGFTSLHIACKKNHLEIVKLLLKYGASLKAVTESGLSCLHIASFMGCVEIVVYLLEHNADIEAQTIRGETPLILATRSNQFEVIDVLLRYGANANAYDQNHQNALHLSARLGNEKIAKLLIDRGIDIDAPTRQMYTALHIAAKENHEKVVALLLENDANISCATKNHEFFPLHLASKYGNDKIVELLLNYGAPVDARGKNDVTSLMVASHYDHPRVVELLLMFGASPHATAKNGYTAMHIAAKGNRIDCSNILLQNGADPNVESKAGFCPLHLASQEGRANMAALLLDNGAHVNCRAKNGITPLHLCAQEDHVNVAQLLVKYGAHLDSQTRNGFTPLHVACHFTRIRMIRFLLANGANVNVPAASGYTSLHQASQQGNPQIVDLLLQYNAKPDALTDNGHSALSIAENLGHVSVIDTLKIVTETVIKTTKTTIIEEKFKIIAPETMQETFVSDSEDEADDTPAHQESVKFLTTDVMRSFNNTMAEDNYNTSQSNLNADMQQLQQAQRQRSQQSSEHLASVPRTTRIADEMSQDLQYLSREAPLDGGESTFGAYSTLGGPQQAPSTTVVRESAYKSTVTTTTRTTTPLGSGDGDALLLDDEDVNQNRLQNDYERTDFRIDGDDDATQVYDYDQRLSGRNTQSPFEDPQQHQQQLEQLAPDNVDIQRPLQQAGSTEPTNFTTLPYTNLADDETAVRQQEELAEVSRVEIERADLDNAREGVDDEPIRMVDLPPESGRTMPSDAEAVSKTELDHHQQQERQPQQQQQRTEQTQQNLQVANSLPLKPFLVSFMVDARGGAMRGCRHSGVRVIIPPNTAPQPMRITCRYLRRERLVHPPPLMEGEACASKIMEVGPAGARFLGPVLIEVPHFASLRGKEREIIILRSDSGEVWREHLFDQDELLVDSIIRSAELVEQQQNDNQENQRPSSAIGQASQKDGGGGDSNQQQQEKRLTRIVTNEFPQYFAIISRIRQEVHTVGPDGLTVDSQVVPRVQAVFTDGALTKRIKIGLQKKNGNSSSPLGSPEPRPRSSTDEQLAESGQDRAKSPSGGRPGSAQAKRKSRFLACFGASHGSHDLLNQSGTDAEGFASGSNESSSSAGGDSPRQLASERLVERRHIIEDLTDSEADSSSLQGDKASKKKKRSATSRELVPDDYYIEQEPAFILNTRPKTYGKRLASSSSQTDQKLQANGYLSTSTKSQKRHGVSLLSAAKRRRNKTQMQIPSHEPTAQKEQQSSQSRLRPKSADLGTSTADSSLESHHADDNLDHLMRSSLEDPFLQAEEDDDEHQKWRNCTIQTDSDSVTVQYVTISSLADPGAAAAAAAATATKTTTTATGQDDGYVSGSGELKRQAADQTASKTGHKGLFLPFCTSSGAAEDDDVADKTADSLSEERDGKRDRKRKKAAAKEKKSKKASGGSGKSSPTKLDVVLEANVDQQPVADVKVESDKLIEASQAADSSPAAPEADRSEAQLSAGEEADESLITSTRSISPSSKERKQQLKLEKQERLKKEKLERQKQKELDEANAKAAKAQKELEEANAKAAKAQKKLEKEAKKKAEKAEKLSKKASKQSPSGSRAQSPESAAAVAVTSDDESKLSQKPVGVLGAITKTIQSVKFAPSPSKDSVDEGKANESSQDQTHIDNLANEQAQVDSGGDSSMVHVSIGSDSALLGDQDQQHDDSNVDQLISFSSDTETIPAVQDIAKLPSSADQTKALKPILKQQSISFEEPQVSAAEIKIEEPKTLSSIADELISEATEEAVQAADAIQKARLSSETSSPTLTSAASDSKKEAAKKVRAEKDRLKAELKSSLDEEKRLKKEAKRLAKQAEEAAKKALHEAQEAREEAERQAEIAKKEAEQVLKLVASQAVDERPAEPLDEPSTASDLVDTAASLTKKTTKQAEAEAKKLAKAAEEEAKRAAKESEAEAKKQAKEAKAEAERLAKEAKAEAERLAKEAKAEAERLAKEEKARLKAEKKAKKSKSKLGVEPSAPSIDLVSSAEESQSSSAKEQSQASPVDDSKSVPIGLPRVSFELKRDNLEVKQENQEKSAGDGQNLADIAEAQDESGPIKTETVTPEELKVEEAPVVSKKSKKIKKEKKRKGSKKDGDTSSIVSTSSSKAESSAAETVSKSSFLGRLFKSKPKQKQQKNDSVVTDPATDPSSEAAEASKKAEEQQQVIVSEMYPSDPNNADGEMILEVNVPQDLISEPRTRSQQAESVYSPEEKVSAVTSVITSTTGQQAAEPTDDQEATLVNLSQMKDDVNDFEDDDEATENVLSQANDFVESQADPPSQSQIESVVHVHDQSLHEPQQIVDDDQAIQLAAMEVEANTQKILLVRDDSLAAQDNLLPQEPEISSKAIGAVDQMQEGTVVEPTQAGPSSVGLDLAKDEKAKKELDAKLEKEAKKQAKIDEKLRKQQEKADKKRAEIEAKKQAKEEKLRLKREAKEAEKLAKLAKKEAQQAKKEAKKNKKKDKSGKPEEIAAVAATSASLAQEASASDGQQQQPTTITTTTITSSTTTTGDDNALNRELGAEADAARLLISSISEMPVNEETEVEQIVEEVVGEDGTVTKTTKTIETKYVTMRQEEVRVAERRDMPLEEWERMQAERLEQAGPSTLDATIERVKRQASVEDYVPTPELQEIQATPSYFDRTQTLPEIKPDTSEKKALKKRIKLNQRLIKRAYKLAKSESKKAKKDQHRAEAEIAVCDEAARQARKELKRAVKEAKRAAKLTEKQHKKMDKIDKKLAKRAKELEKRQKKIDKRLAKAAKKRAKKEAKAAAKEAKLQRAGSNSSSSKSSTRGSKRSIKAEDIGAPVLRSSSRLSIVQNNPNVELSPRQEQFAEAGLERENLPNTAQAASSDLQVDMSLEDSAPLQATGDLSQEQIEKLVRDGEHEVVYTITRDIAVEHGDDGLPPEHSRETQILTGPEAEAAAMRLELEAAREEEELIDVVGDGEPDTDRPTPEASPTEEQPEKENVKANGESPTTPSGKKKNKRKNKKQKSKESAE